MKASVWMAAMTAALVCMGCTTVGQGSDAGFVDLFNGRDLTGWCIVGNAEGFQVENGIIHSDSGSGAHWMYYDQSYGDFVLRVEWRVSERGNSGVFLRAPKEGNPWETGWEVQISCEEPRRDDSHCTGALYAYVAVDPRPDETPGQWRVYEITCRGNNVSVVVDGQEVCRVEQSTLEQTKDKPLVGFVGVQDSHGPEGTWVEYRKIQIKAL